MPWPFDGTEVLHLPDAGLGEPARAAVQRAVRAALGNSDAHVVEAIGKGYTRFPGRTAEDLAAAIRAGCTAPGPRLYGPATVRAYARFVCEARAGQR